MVSSKQQFENFQHISLGPDQFYWAELDTKAIKKHRISSQSLSYLFETVLPVPIDDVHAVYIRSTPQLYIACGIDKKRLEAHVQENMLALTPAVFPDFIKAENIQPEQFNLLAGQYAPPIVQKLQYRWGVCAAVLLVLLTAFLVFGLERRINHLHDQAAIYQNQQLHIAQAVLGPSATNSLLPPNLQLTALLRELRSTREVKIESKDEINATKVLAELCTHWPDELETQTNSIAITAQGISVQVELPDSSAAQKLAESINSIHGWSLEQPRINASDDSVRTTIRLARQTDRAVKDAR